MPPVQLLNSWNESTFRMSLKRLLLYVSLNQRVISWDFTGKNENAVNFFLLFFFIFEKKNDFPS